MAKYFGDIGKAVKDVLTGGLSYDNKFNISSKATDDLSVKAESVMKGSDLTGDATATYVVDKDLSAELKLSDKGAAKVSVTKSGVVDGLKTVASADPSNLAKSLKVANTLMHGDIGVKADVSNALGGNPKIDASACLNLGDAQVGAEASLDATKGLASYALAAQLAADDLTVSAVISDQLSTIKAGAALKIDKDTTAAAEAMYKLNGGDLKLAAGIATKLDNGHAVRAAVCSAGHVSASYKANVMDGLDATACLQVDKDMKYKYGIQGTYKA